VNLGSAFEISIRDLTVTIARGVGFTREIRWDTIKPNGQPRRNLDTSRAKELFGFEECVRFEESLQKTVYWFIGRRAWA